MFKVSYDYKRELDSHMMKNTEWGAVAYLSHSKYGIKDSQGNISTPRINNNSNYVTGYAGTEEPTTATSPSSIEGNIYEKINPGLDGEYTVNYYNPSSVIASTTGNYSGIYDMSGGTAEYVMGNINNSPGESSVTTIISDFYQNSMWNKYVDKYASAASMAYSNRILGDATGEMGPFYMEAELTGSTNFKSSWYQDYAHFIIEGWPWFFRGFAYNGGTSAGIFAMNSINGVNGEISFRITLAP